MKRRYKLLLIVIIGIFLTIFINGLSVTKKITLVSLGDGLSIGMTPYNVAGTSFNDYLKERFESVNNLECFNNEFSISHLRVHELNEYIEKNSLGKITKDPIKQTLAKANIITIAIGIDELADKSLVNNLNTETIDNYLKEISSLLAKIREFYQEEIILIGTYPAYGLSKKDAVGINKRLQIICGKYNANFLDILAISLDPNYYLEENSYYLNYKAHKKIAKTLYTMYKNK